MRPCIPILPRFSIFRLFLQVMWDQYHFCSHNTIFSPPYANLCPHLTGLHQKRAYTHSGTFSPKCVHTLLLFAHAYMYIHFHGNPWANTVGFRVRIWGRKYLNGCMPVSGVILCSCLLSTSSLFSLRYNVRPLQCHFCSENTIFEPTCVYMYERWAHMHYFPSGYLLSRGTMVVICEQIG